MGLRCALCKQGVRQHTARGGAFWHTLVEPCHKGENVEDSCLYCDEQVRRTRRTNGTAVHTLKIRCSENDSNLPPS